MQVRCVHEGGLGVYSFILLRRHVQTLDCSLVSQTLHRPARPPPLNPKPAASHLPYPKPAASHLPYPVPSPTTLIGPCPTLSRALPPS